MYSCHISVLFYLQRQAGPEKKRPHRSTVYLATHKKKDTVEKNDKNERLVGKHLMVLWLQHITQSNKYCMH